MGHYIKQRGGDPENLKAYLRIMKCLLKAVREIHRKSCVPGDLDLDYNIFIEGNETKSLIAKIGELEMFRDISHSRITGFYR